MRVSKQHFLACSKANSFVFDQKTKLLLNEMKGEEWDKVVKSKH